MVSADERYSDALLEAKDTSASRQTVIIQRIECNSRYFLTIVVSLQTKIFFKQGSSGGHDAGNEMYFWILIFWGLGVALVLENGSGHGR